MGVEIERRFLLQEIPALSGLHLYRQGYLSSDPVVRVRVSNDTHAWITIKGRGSVVRPEYEYEIPVTDATELLDLQCKYVLHKNRYRVIHEGRTWVVDQFLGKLHGLWLTEIELKSLDESFEIPSWVGREVTQDYRYTNVYLAEDGIPGDYPGAP